ncbi:hypothetical protein Lfu02_57300 [Longispora fulva]|uniref:DUF4037 domain-containing protein n=1 Tax=Longispora fulva TaxID=619741 RepID=A0A8J7GEK9_9ACTN|nr:DUF4037 domain-containing protein [Longispora fulva]MBG6137289.1 hypothetical protein [Longispora fulva]GIG61358.1 hypothetical protein Lfu02_57300 [Longispora fulva]
MTTGVDLADAFHRDIVGPLIATAHPGLRYAAGRLGSGSDVLGFDDARSRDHDWGCRLTVLVDGADRAAVGPVHAMLTRELPETYQGRPVRFPTTWSPEPTHEVEVATVGDFATSRLGVDPVPGLSTTDWLLVTGQGVLEVTGGAVFADTTTELGPVRSALAWYPPEVDRYVVAAGWGRLGQRLPFVGRTAQTGQERQSRLLAAELVADLTQLAFLLARRWAPYEKWTQRALPWADELAGPLDRALDAGDWHGREDGLVAAVELLLDKQRARGLPTPEVGVSTFWDRPYRMIDPAVTADLLAGLTDPVLSVLPTGLGAIGQWVDNVDVLAHPARRATLAATYRSLGDARLTGNP